jgi:thiamine-monophosphate kinase
VVRRSGAKPGDWLLVTGPLGGSIRAHHLDFTPRVREALALHTAADLHAMIDISDGLARDLHHVCDESRCGAVVFAGYVPITEDAQLLAAQDGRSPLLHALSDGEDFELIVAVSPADGARLIATQPVAGITLSHIGECLAAGGVWLDEAGQRRALPPLGYSHEF